MVHRSQLHSLCSKISISFNQLSIMFFLIMLFYSYHLDSSILNHLPVYSCVESKLIKLRSLNQLLRPCVLFLRPSSWYSESDQLNLRQTMSHDQRFD